MLHNRVMRSLFICCLLLFTFTKPNSASEEHHEVTDIMEEVSSAVCSSKTSTFNKPCFLKVIHDYFARFTWCASTHASCFMCNDSTNELGEKLFSLYNSGEQIGEHEMEKVAISLMVLTHDKNTFCKSNPASLGIVANYTYDNYWEDMSSESGFKKDKSDWLDHVYEDFAKSFNTTKNTKCATSKMIIEESHASEMKTDQEWAKAVSLFSVLHILNGYQLDKTCTVLPTQAAILGNLYRALNVSTNSPIPESGILKIMAKLNIGNTSSSTSGDDHDHDHDHGHNHRRKRSIHTLRRVRRAVVYQDANISQCLTVDNLFDIYNVDESVGVSLMQLKELCPAFLEQALSDTCANKPPAETQSISQAEAYGYGALAVFIVCFGSLLGAVFIPCMDKKSFDLIMLFAIALSIGTLLCDSLLHLIPDALGLHSHEHTGPAQFEPPQPYFYKMLALSCLIYLWYLIELSLVYWFSNSGHSHHGHSHMPENATTYANVGFEMGENGKGSNLELVSVKQISNDTNGEKTPSTGANGVNIQRASVPVVESGIESSSVKNSKFTALFVISGDSIHNFADGLAIGAAFASSLSSGISTCIAILCHELPHELGDFAILLSSNMGVKKALLMNFISALAAFVGFFVGVPIGANEEARNWIFIITGSIFIYISLSSLLSSTKQSCPSSKCTSFLVQASGFLVGIIIIVIIGLFENLIRV